MHHRLRVESHFIHVGGIYIIKLEISFVFYIFFLLRLGNNKYADLYITQNTKDVILYIFFWYLRNK